jgi:hypothetical protein
MLNRRTFLSLSAAMMALGARPARADGGAERKFLFVLCKGGWDPSYVFAPQFDKPYVDTESDATSAIANGIPFVDHADRPNVRSFFEDWGHKSCVLNGFEIQSITHDRCLRLLLTGSGGNGKDDWGSTLAAHSANELLLPYVVLSGSSYAFDHVSEVVRVGNTGQLPDLLTTSGNLIRSDQTVPLPGAASEAAVRAYLRDRATAYGATAGAGRPQRYAELFERTVGQVDRLAELSDTLDFRGGSGTPTDGLEIWATLEVAVNTLGMGAARCAMVQYDGLWSMSWDSHSGIAFQSNHFEGLFAHLNKLMEKLEAEPGTAGGSLLDEVTVVVLSEMGRGPRLNTWGGKDHFTFTSAMLMGSGVRGGLSIGGGDDYGIGRRMDLNTGELTDSGTAVQASHLGATLLALGDIDPAQELPDSPPILAMLE